MNWITKNFTEVFNDIVDGSVDYFTSLIVAIFDDNVEIFTSVEITSVELVLKTLAITLVIVVIIKEIFTTYVTETDGDPDSDPMQLLVRASEALAWIEGNSLFFDIMQELSRRLTNDIIGTCSARKFMISMDTLIMNIGSITNPGMVVGMIVGTLVICIIMTLIFAFKAGLRGGELIVARLLLPIFTVDKIKSNPERWNAFMTNYAVTFLCYSFQLFLMRCGFNRIIAAMEEGINAVFMNYFAGLILIYLSIKMPKWLDKFVYSSGIGQIAGNAGRSLTYMIPSMLMRR